MSKINIEYVANQLLSKMNLNKDSYPAAHNLVKNYVNSCSCIPDETGNIDDANTVVLESCMNLYKNMVADYNAKLKNNVYLSDENISNIAAKLSKNNDYIPNDNYALKSLINVTIKLYLIECRIDFDSVDDFNDAIIEKCKKMLNI